MTSPAQVSPALRNPYVGPRPFEPEDHGRFFGRDREVGEVVSLIIAHRALLIYAESGAGKSSLINAGIISKLKEEEGFQVLPPSRVRGLIPEAIPYGGISNLYAFNTLLSWVGAEVDPGQLAQVSLADFLGEAERPTDEDNQPVPRVAIFDQFEELFTSYPERWQDREDFFKQVRQALEADPLLRVVFVMREDYIAQMDPYTSHMPENLRTRFRLERMGRQAALAAVSGPLAGSGCSFAEGVAETLVQELLKIQVQRTAQETVEAVGEFVEPVQLQVVCEGLWRDLPPEVSQIEGRHLQNSGDVTQALASYYENVLVDIVSRARVTEDSLRQWFDETLITSAGTRGTVFRGDADTGGISNSAVDILEDLHLIRAEIRGGSRWYELTHDRFIQPIRAANERSNLLRARRARRRAFIKVGVSASLVTLVLLAVITSIGFALLQGGRAKQQAELAQARQLALSAIGIFASGEQLDLAALLSLEASRRADNNFNSRNSLLIGLQSTPPQLVTHLSSHTAGVSTLGISPDGKVLVSGSRDNTIIRWDLATGNQLGEPLVGHASWVTAVAFSPDGKMLASGGADNNVILWNSATGEKLGPVLTGHQETVIDLVFRPDSATLVSGSTNGSVILWDVATGQPLDELVVSGPTDLVDSLAFTQDGGALAASFDDETIILRETATGEPLGEPLTGHTGAVTSLVFSLDGSTLASGGFDASVIVWDVTSGEMLGLPLSGHPDMIDSLAFSPDGRMLASGSLDGTVIRWDVASGKMLGLPFTSHTDSVISLAFSPDSRVLATGSADDSIILWDVAAPLRLGRTLATHADQVTSLDFNLDGQVLAAGSADGTAILWDVATGEILGPVLTGHADIVNSVAFRPDRRMLASGSGDHTIILWDVATRQQLGQPLTGHTAAVTSVAFSPLGSVLASGSNDRTIILWDVATRRQLAQPLTGHNFGVLALAFSTDGKVLASGSADRTIILWEVATGQLVGELTGGHTGAIQSLDFSQDGEILASGSADNTVILWDVARRESLVQPLTGHSGEVTSIDFSPDGQMLTSGSSDGTVILWDVEERQRLGQPFTSHADQVNSVAFEPEGQVLASGSSDSNILVWDLSIDSWRDRACRIANRNLTTEEWERYIGEESYRKTCPR